VPWAEGEKIPWHEPAFSQRMLREHLSQEHNMASRRLELIEAQIEWIWQALLAGRPAAVLDLGCGPGLYTARLAGRGCPCRGIDFSPASIDYARQTAAAAGLTCAYDLADVRSAPLGDGYALAMMLFGELNVFRPDETEALLRRCRHALAPGGRLLIEVSSFAAVEQMGRAGRSWHSFPTGGLFSPDPHLFLYEPSWHAAERAAVERYAVLPETGETVQLYASASQAYSDDDYRQLLARCGFTQVERFPSLLGVDDSANADLVVYTARRPA
jgi:SAM-dependent methyltransferase